jgi:ABC-type sugar transport system permease subunit
MLRESLFAVVMLGLIGTLKVFDFVWIMTGGGPANATMLPGPLAYQEAFVQFNYGDGSAIIILTVVLMVVLSLVYVRLTSPRNDNKPPRKVKPPMGAPAIVPVDRVPAANVELETAGSH